MNEKKEARLRRAKSTRLKIRELGAVRLCVNRTPRHIYAQVISACGEMSWLKPLLWMLACVKARQVTLKQLKKWAY